MLVINYCKWLADGHCNSQMQLTTNMQLWLGGNFSKPLGLNRICIRCVSSRCWSVLMVMLIFILVGNKMFGVSCPKSWRLLPNR